MRWSQQDGYALDFMATRCWIPFGLWTLFYLPHIRCCLLFYLWLFLGPSYDNCCDWAHQGNTLKYFSISLSTKSPIPCKLHLYSYEIEHRHLFTQVITTTKGICVYMCVFMHIIYSIQDFKVILRTSVLYLLTLLNPPVLVIFFKVLQ